MKNTINELKKERCTGCAGCYNVCRTGALTMLESSDGFVYPQIDAEKCTECGMCAKVCPVINSPKKNASSPKLFAARASDEIREKSSSGGIFTVMAEKIISLGGAVCGAAFDTEMKLRHIIVNSIDELKKLRGSKYVQSEIGSIYRDIEEILKKDRYVLFTGTPCQCAALRNYLKKDYDRLFIIDLLCHGVPSQKSFSMYLSEISKGRSIVDVKFRDKRFGWNADYISVKFADGTEYMADKDNDPYLKGFLRNLTLRGTCGKCSFSEFQRQGDISIGDFWGITAIDKTQSDGKGTSLVFVNTKKGSKMMSMAEEQLSVKEYDFAITTIKNRVMRDYPLNANRYRFLKFMESGRNSFGQSVKKSLTRHFDIGIVSNYYAGNFGGSLTQYALYNVLEDMGYSCLMIERPAEAIEKANLETVKRIYLKFPYPDAAIARQRATKAEMEELNNFCDTFVVGSDQLFQWTLYNELGKFVTLDWVFDRKKKIAYAASYGHDYIWGDKEELAVMGYYMRKFDAFSVREQSGVDISQKEFGVDAEWVLDPVFLCDKKHYYSLGERSEKKFPKHFIGSYILDPTSEKAEILKTVQKKLGLKAKVVSELSHNPQYEEPLKELDVEHLKIEERLQLIKECDFFVTDSFHGTCFAIIMGKPFISILNTNRGGSRFKSLLSLFGLENRLITNLSDLNENIGILSDIDFDVVNLKLNKEKERCLDWLRKAVSVEKRPIYSDYDVLMKLIKEQQNEIAQLKEQIELLSMGETLAFKRIRNVQEYIDTLVDKSSDYVVVIAVKDTPGLSLSAEAASSFQKLGITTDLSDQHWRSFVAVIDCGKVIAEQISAGKIAAEKKVGDLKISVHSANLKAGNKAEIKVNGKECAVNKRGLNIAIIDRESGNIIDSACLDMHLKKYQLIR